MFISNSLDTWLYPIRYEEEVNNYAAKYHVEPALVEAVIRVESKFNEQAVSESGAVGLMQIMPETGEWIAHQLNEEYGDLQERDRNINYGAWYLAELTTEFGGNKVLALAAYNAGRGTVWDWIEEFSWDKDFEDIEKIPYKETKEYVKKVLISYEKYKELGVGGGQNER